MGMSWAYGGADDAESIRVIRHALDIGVDFLDTAETYGPFTNEELIGRALKGKRRETVVIATKFAWKFGPNNEQIGLDSSPANIKKSIEGSLRRLGTSYIDLYYQHRLDPNTPIEDTVGAMADLVKQGKVRYIGLSEVGPGTIRRAHKVHPLSAVQSEYSLWTRDPEAGTVASDEEGGNSGADDVGIERLERHRSSNSGRFSRPRLRSATGGLKSDRDHGGLLAHLQGHDGLPRRSSVEVPDVDCGLQRDERGEHAAHRKHG